MGSGSPRQTQDGQDLLLHLFLLAAAEPPEAGMDQALGLLAPQGETEQEQQEQGPRVEERLVGSGGGSALEDAAAAAAFAHVLLFHFAAKTREAVGDFCVHGCGLLLFLLLCWPIKKCNLTNNQLFFS